MTEKPQNRAARRKAASKRSKTAPAHEIAPTVSAEAPAKAPPRKKRRGLPPLAPSPWPAPKEGDPPAHREDDTRWPGDGPTLEELLVSCDEDIDELATTPGSAGGEFPPHWAGANLMTGSADQILAHLAVGRALPAEILQGLAARRSLAIAIVMPTETWSAHVQEALDALVFANRAGLSKQDSVAGQHHALFASRGPTAKTNAANMREFSRSLARGGRLIVHTEAEASLPPELRLILDAIITIPPPDPALLAETIQIITGDAPDASRLEGLGGLSLETIAMAIRRRSTAEDCARRLRLAGERLMSVHVDDSVPPLETIPGYGAAGEWGLRLARDFTRLRAGETIDLPRGILLSGPPGTGKSMFARALAKSCGVPLTVTSVGDWFATGEGHLGDIMRTAKAAITRARTIGGILFIDEIDSISPRDAEHGRNRGFQVQFVNGILGMIDGCLGSPGFVLVGACNDAERVDAALRRAGRLDQTIAIGLPDADAREAILRMHLAADLVDADLGAIARGTEGRSGADLALYVRNARQVARDEGRPLALVDLVAAATPPDPRGPAELRTCAIHEAGHTVAALMLGHRIVRVDVMLDGETGGGLVVERRTYVKTRADVEAEIVMLLGGRAADEVLGAGPHDGAGGHASSDLARATRLAIAIHASLGLGANLAYRAPTESAEVAALYDASLLERVEAELQGLYEVAKDLIRAQADLCLAIAEALVSRRVLDGREIEEIAAASAKASVLRRQEGRGA
ncbi:AAA family ATPase [Salinarimonas sp. NSM]|uniref:AAA family ATPase n=1 Tax=Salinarimonas sp. NSM TaxID=3458003 RepID=UPI004036E8BF